MADTEKLLLAADIGGTKTYIGLFAPGKKAPRAVRTARAENAEFNGAPDLIGRFLDSAKGARVAASCIAVACPVENGRGVLTNTGWVVDAKAIGRRFGIKRVELINDLAATGWGLGLLSRKDFLTLQRGRKRPGNAALIGAGTGLGEAALYWDGKTHTPSASEGGHTDFAPQSELEMELLRFLLRSHSHVSYERVVSGQGLVNIFRFLSSRRPGGARAARAVLSSKDPAAEIFRSAEAGKEKTCIAAIEMFVSVYGAEAGNLALKTLPVSGLYLCGGIAPKLFAGQGSAAIGKRLVKAFVASFAAKGRMGEMLRRVPINVITNDRAALFGAARCAKMLLDGKR